jgi:TatD DNase family protein
MIIDSHCHLPPDNEKIKELLIEAKKHNITHVINIGTDVKTNKQVIESAKQFEEVFCTVGIYPNSEKDKYLPDLAESLVKSLNNDKIVGIGECGIDLTNYENQRPIKEQIELFEMQVAMATDKKLPLIIHNRNRNNEILEIIKKYVPLGLTGVQHCFDGDYQYAKQLWNLGFYISFSGLISIKSKTELLEVVKKAPKDLYLVETDAPYLKPKNSNSNYKRNTPDQIRYNIDIIAKHKNISINQVAQETYINTIKLFGLKKWLKK